MITFFPELLKWRHMERDISSKQTMTFFPELLKWHHMETDISSKQITFFPELLRRRDKETVANKRWYSSLSYGRNLLQLSSSIFLPWKPLPLRWRHNECVGVSNHQPHDCLLNRLFKAQIKENIKAPRHWPLCGNSPVTGEFPTLRASNAENVSI